MPLPKIAEIIQSLPIPENLDRPLYTQLTSEDKKKFDQLVLEMRAIILEAQKEGKVLDQVISKEERLALAQNHRIQITDDFKVITREDCRQEVYSKSFNEFFKLNINDLAAKKIAIQTFFNILNESGLLEHLRHQHESMIIEDVGCGNGKFSVHAYQYFKALYQLHFEWIGIEPNEKLLPQAKGEFTAEGFDGNVKLFKGYYGEINSDSRYNELSANAAIRIISHLYSSGLLKNGIEKFNEAVNIFIHSKHDIGDILAEEFSELFTLNEDYHNTIARKFSEEKVHSGTFNYHFTFPDFKTGEGSWDNVWAALAAPGTAEFQHSHYKSLTAKETQCKDLLQFFLVGPIEHLDKAKRLKMLNRVRDFLESKNYKIEYCNVVQVIAPGKIFSQEEHSILEKEMRTFSARAQAEINDLEALERPLNNRINSFAFHRNPSNTGEATSNYAPL